MNLHTLDTFIYIQTDRQTEIDKQDNPSEEFNEKQSRRFNVSVLMNHHQAKER